MAATIRITAQFSTTEIVLATCATIALTTAFRLLLGLVFGISLLYAIYYPVIIAIALLLGARAAIAATLMTIVAVWWSVMPPKFSFSPLSPSDIANFVLFGAACLALIAIATFYRSSLEIVAQQQKQLDYMLRETQHRGRNLLTMLHLIARHTIRDEQERARLIGRMQAIAHTQDLIDEFGDNIDMRTLFMTELARVFYDLDSVASFEGPPLLLSGPAAKSLRLVIHELTMNAAKHGALSVMGGRVLIAWQAHDDVVILKWTEVNGPAVEPPRMLNFGSQLMEQSLVDLSGRSVPEYLSTGYCYTITLDARRLRLQPSETPQVRH